MHLKIRTMKGVRLDQVGGYGFTLRVGGVRVARFHQDADWRLFMGRISRCSNFVAFTTFLSYECNVLYLTTPHCSIFTLPRADGLISLDEHHQILVCPVI